MNKENLEKIVADLDDLKNLVDFFSTQEEIPAIEIDIVKRKLQDIYLLFSKYQEKKEEIESEKTSTLLTEMENEQATESVKKEPAFESNQESKETKPEPIQKEEKEKKKEKQEEIAPPTTKSTNSGTTLSDKLKGNNVSLNDRLSSTKGSDLSSRLKKGPIKDLNEAIGLNDKFSYIKKLFGGDAHKFRESIDQLNSMHSFSEAENFISSNFSWNMEDATTQQFLDLVHRKIQSNG